MALSKKPTKSTVDVEALILKGGSVPTSSPKPTVARAAETPVSMTDEKEKKIMLQLRLPQEIVEEIDGLIEKRVLRISRHAWFMEALSEKIMKERG